MRVLDRAKTQARATKSDVVAWCYKPKKTHNGGAASAVGARAVPRIRGLGVKNRIRAARNPAARPARRNGEPPSPSSGHGEDQRHPMGAGAASGFPTRHLGSGSETISKLLILKKQNWRRIWIHTLVRAKGHLVLPNPPPKEAIVVWSQRTLIPCLQLTTPVNHRTISWMSRPNNVAAIYKQLSCYSQYQCDQVHT